MYQITIKVPFETKKILKKVTDGTFHKVWTGVGGATVPNWKEVPENTIDYVATREKLLKRLVEFTDRLKQDDCKNKHIHRIVVEQDPCDFAYRIIAELI